MSAETVPGPCANDACGHGRKWHLGTDLDSAEPCHAGDETEADCPCEDYEPTVVPARAALDPADSARHLVHGDPERRVVRQ